MIAQAFVDSGAQSTIMSSKCAEKSGLLHLLDDRFEGVAVGVITCTFKLKTQEQVGHNQ